MCVYICTYICAKYVLQINDFSTYDKHVKNKFNKNQLMLAITFTQYKTWNKVNR